ncbi:MAG: hypothetical protein WC869_09975 [Phycisphaerae bacterium]|jgi:hypothetical protein
MPTFSAEMTYKVAKDGTANVYEIRSVHNPSNAPVTFATYKEVLPPSVDLGTLKCLLVHDDQQHSLSFRPEICAGTDRKLLQVDGIPIVCPHGTTHLQTECRIKSFYSVYDDKHCYMFSFHHSLPDLPFFGDALVNKKIIVLITKPVNRFLWKWSMLIGGSPVSGAVRQIEDFSPHIKLEFVFDISRTRHFYTTVVLRRHRRFTFLGAVLSAAKSAVLKRINPHEA